MMKTLLAVIGFAVSTSAIHADSIIPSRLTLAPISSSLVAPTRTASGLPLMPALTLAPLSGTGTMIGTKLNPSSANFAQLGSVNPTMPLPSGLILTLVAIFVLALRIMGLNHARAMADHERQSYQGKAQMSRSLHEGGSDH
jgi:hypothetical protein